MVVLGDIGRSPRMQYHALALAGTGAEVDLIGVAGAEPFAAVRVDPAIRLHLLSEGALPRGGSGFLPLAFLRALRLGLALLTCLLRRSAPDVILVQNPPAIPTLAAALLAARLRGTRLVIDWHNFGFAMLALRLGETHGAVRLTAWCEGAFGRRGDAHLCVSRALQRALAERWGIEAAVLYDRPARQFVPLPPGRRDPVVRALCRRVGFETERRPVVVVSPTSWTADEDFALLLDALAQCEARLGAGPDTGARLLVLLTGRGPLRAEYEPRLGGLPRTRVRAHAVWLPPDEYGSALAAADLGLSLHRSASGLDLPMKIADMFGAGLPVCALDYGPCLREVVRPGENAILFASAGDLVAHLCALVRGDVAQAALLARLRAGALAAAAERWEDAWAAHAAPLVLGDGAGHAAR